MNRSSLYCIRVESVPAELEEAVGSLLESSFAQSPVIFADHESGLSEISIYSGATAGIRSSKLPTLREKLGSLWRENAPAKDWRLTIRRVRPRDWKESWKRHFKPIEIGKHLVLKPSWSRKKAKRNQVVVVLDPGLSFGTGHHPTTFFCLEQIVRLRPQSTARSLLDVGTGSGILAISAARLGYRPVVAYDVDPDALSAARRNCSKNRCRAGVSFARVDLTGLPVKSHKTFDVICANLTDDLLIFGAPRLATRLSPGGTLLLAGVLSYQFSQVQTRFESLRFRLVQRVDAAEWSSGAFAKPART